jgi:hypothetical protein
VTQSGCYIMHTVDLGIWVHLITAIAVKIDRTIRRYGILPAKRVAAVWEKLATRGMQLNADDTMVKLNAYKANYLKILVEEKRKQMSQTRATGKKKPQAWEHHLLMHVSSSPQQVWQLPIQHIIRCNSLHGQDPPQHLLHNHVQHILHVTYKRD